MDLKTKQLFYLLGLLFALALSSTSFAQHTSKKVHHKNKAVHVSHKEPSAPAVINGAQNLSAAINNAIASVDPNLNIGVAVKSMTTGEILYTHQAQRPFVPASILKVITAEAALIYLGSDYKFQTNFYTDATGISNGVLYGNLYLVHSGDPSLTYYDLIDLVDSLKGQQIQRIQGNIYIDTSAYDQVNYGPGWIWSDKTSCFAAPINASIINHNCLSFRVVPAKDAAHKSDEVASQPFFYTGMRPSPNAPPCYIQLGKNPNTTLTISGCFPPKGRYVQGVTSVIGDVMEYNKALLRALFRNSDIQVTGMILAGVAPPNLSVISVHHSKPLYELITSMLKKSDNIIAGSLFKKLGETYTRKQGSWESGNFAVTNILSRNAGVNITNMQVLDGSGLSRYNQVTPLQMLQVLDYAYHNPATNYEFMSGLPVAGTDGTLKHRLQNIARKVRAKTGTMSGVNSLAGYAISNNKEPLAFVIIVNGQFGMGWRYKELEDRIVTYLTKYSH